MGKRQQVRCRNVDPIHAIDFSAHFLGATIQQDLVCVHTPPFTRVTERASESERE